MIRRSTRKVRYIVFAVSLLAIWYIILPLHAYTRGQKSHNDDPPRIQFEFGKEDAGVKTVRMERQQQVRNAFLHAWTGYKKLAWLHDEVMPITGGSKDPFAGWAATLVDGLDTLYIMHLQDEFKDALKAISAMDFSTPNVERVPVFEATIRYLGGLLGAYDVSGGAYPMLLQKADQLGEFLFRAFDTPNGIPVPYYFWRTPEAELEGEPGVLVAQIGELEIDMMCTALTCLGSLSLEFTRLAQLTGKRKYFDAISRITNYFDDAQNSTEIPGLWPSQMDTRIPSFKGSSFTLGAWADSLYEYLPKVITT